MNAMRVFDCEAPLCESHVAEIISLLAMAGLTLDELRAYWRVNLKHIR